jgi:hypothetical protein
MNFTQTAFIFAAVFGTMTLLPLASTYADTASNETVASQPQQGSSVGPYDGADYEAARHQYNN